MERVPGISDLSPLAESQRRAVITAFVDVISDMHNLPIEELDLPGFERPSTPEEHATLDLGMWARLAEHGVPELDPLVRFAGSYLRTHPPARVARSVFVQGDTGPGNFLAEDGRISALVDMEFAHLGDPMDDLAWMMMRTASTGIDVTDLFPRYTTRTGIAIDPRSIEFYRIAVQYRCAVTTSLAVARGGGARGLAPYLLVTERYLVGLAAALSSYLSVAEEVVVPPNPGPSVRTAYYDHLMDGLRLGVRGIEDPDLREETRNLQILVHYLRAHDRIGRDVEEEETEDLRGTLGIAPDDQDALAEIVESAGRSADENVLRYLLRRTQRGAMLWQTVLERPRR